MQDLHPLNWTGKLYKRYNVYKSKHNKYQLCFYTILLGPGLVPFVIVDQATCPPCFQWGELVFVSDDVTNLTYNVSVSGADSPSFTITTSDTKYCPELSPCQEYTITVTPFSTFPDYVDSSNKTKAIIIGGTFIRIRTRLFNHKLLLYQILGNFCICWKHDSSSYYKNF